MSRGLDCNEIWRCVFVCVLGSKFAATVLSQRVNYERFWHGWLRLRCETGVTTRLCCTQL